MKSLTLNRLFFSAIVALFSIAFFAACNKSKDNGGGSQEKNALSETMTSFQYATFVSIKCPGCTADGCNMQQARDENGQWYSECFSDECSYCSMTITTSKISYSSPETYYDTTVTSASRYHIHFYDAFKDYITVNYPNLTVAVKQIEIIKDELNDTYVILYEYKLSDATVGSVMFMKKAETTTQIDCHGTYACRERYYPSTGAVECTCDECKMDIKTISKASFGL